MAAARTAHRPRTAAVTLALLALVLALAWLTLTWGGLAGEFLGTLRGEASFAIVRLRLPRLALATGVGIAFALAGALFQTVLRNPLASPDILGINAGASLAGAFAILVLGLAGAAVSGFAILGALGVALAIHLLAWRDGVSGQRFVLVGVGIAFVVNSAIGYLLTRAEVSEVRSALVWLVGSIGTPPWDRVATLGVGLALLLPLVAAAGPRLRILELGDDVAGGLGLSVQVTRTAVLGLAVVLAAVATAFAGPVAFVAFVSAPIARRLLPEAGLALVPSALVGAVVVLAAELVAQHLLGALEVPVGIVTGLIGAPYLLWLLATSNRGRGA
ncbi:MAG: iron ABC transporter permease [Actinobacteria bacterium]|nr:iron ABC transporter permease [Actinomycetota bacterium]